MTWNFGGVKMECFYLSAQRDDNVVEENIYAFIGIALVHFTSFASSSFFRSCR